MNAPVPLAKLSRPRTAGLIPRPRLFERLDSACARGVAWVHGPSGSGKTSLLATWIEARKRPPLWFRADEDDSDAATLVHFLGRLAALRAPAAPPLPALTPEYLGGLGTFARRFMRDFYARLPAPFVLVLDDVHEIGADSPAQVLLGVALSEVPPGSAVVLCGRTAPPPGLARFALDQGAVTWTDLQLDGSEARALLEHIDPGNDRDVEALRMVSQGWVAGFALLAARPCEPPAEGWTLAPATGDALFAYFSYEVLARCDAEERAFLLATAPLATITLEQARALTGREDAEEVLETLRCGQFFITRLAGEPPRYRCHPLFHAFLCHEARRTLPPLEWLRRRLAAAALAEAAGDIQTAVSLCMDARAWPELSGLLCRAAPGLVSQGRHALLEQWIGQIPTDVADNTPWLLYWLGTAQVCAGRMRRGRALLERAYGAFEVSGEMDGLLLAWGGIIESFSFEWDDVSPVSVWASRIQTILPADLLALRAPVIARLLSTSMALQVADRTHPVNRRLVALALELLDRPDLEAAQGPATTVVLVDRLFGGDFAGAQAMLDLVTGARDFPDWPPLGRMAFGRLGAGVAWQSGNAQLAYELMERVLKQAEETGIHGTDFVTLTQGVYAALSVRDGGRALTYLKRLRALLRPDRRGDAAHLEALTGCWKLLTGDHPGARVDLEHAAQMLERLGMGFAILVARAMLAWVLVLQGEFDQARGLGRETLARTRTAGTESIEFEARVALAYTELAGGARAAARKALRAAFGLGRRNRYFITGPVWLPEVMARLCAEALEAGIEETYALELIDRRALQPPSPEVEHWPWPVRIHTLGQFSIAVSDDFLHLERKRPGRPIQMLQALIALGGREVGVGTLLEALWPDAEGDDAANAFNVTLLRLRRLLGDGVLLLCDHKVSLDERRCWLDAWALERIVHRFEAAGSNGAGRADVTALAEQALRLYRGPFLVGEHAGWSAPARSRLRSRFLRLIGGCARDLRAGGASAQAATLCRRVLEVEPVAEDILVELVTALLADGLTAQATAALRESELLFHRLLGRSPSPALWRLVDP